jgi:hypothetical protein
MKAFSIFMLSAALPALSSSFLSRGLAIGWI